MTNCRIDFTGQQAQLCASEPIRISRVQPAAMSPHMPTTAWTAFCDRIDEALAPLDRIKHWTRIGMIVFFVAFIIIMIAPFTWLATSSSSSSNPWDQPSFGFGGFWAFLVGPLLLMGGMISMSCLAAKRARSALSGVEAVCEDVSKQYSALSFHVRFEYYAYGRYGGGYNHHTNTYHHGGRSTYTTNYIEVNIAPDVESVLPSTFASPSAPPLVTASVLGERSAAERLRDLDEMRGMLSDEEYDRKRKEILDSV